MSDDQHMSGGHRDEAIATFASGVREIVASRHVGLTGILHRFQGAPADGDFNRELHIHASLLTGLWVVGSIFVVTLTVSCVVLGLIVLGVVEKIGGADLVNLVGPLLIGMAIVWKVFFAKHSEVSRWERRARLRIEGEDRDEIWREIVATHDVDPFGPPSREAKSAELASLRRIKTGEFVWGLVLGISILVSFLAVLHAMACQEDGCLEDQTSLGQAIALGLTAISLVWEVFLGAGIDERMTLIEVERPELFR